MRDATRSAVLCVAAALCAAAASAQPGRVDTGVQLRLSDTLDGVGAVAQPEGPVRTRAEPVASDPPGPARLRGLSLRVTSGIRFDDNVLRTDSDTRRDTVLTLRPAAYLDGRVGKHDLRLGYEADISRYLRLSDENRFDHALLASARLDLDRRLKAGLEANLDFGSDPRGALDSRAVAAGRPDRWRRHNLSGDVTVGRRIARAEIGLGYEIGGRRYLNNGQQDRDFDRRGLRLHGRWNVSPRLGVVGELAGAWLDYLDPVTTLDSREYTALAGVAWEATAKTSGAVKLGVRRLEFHDAGNADLSGFTWDARVEWSPKTYSRFSVYTTRAVSESAFLPGSTSSSTATSDLYGVRWRHGLSERLTFDAAVERTVAAFEAGGKDRFLSLEAGLRYRADPRLDLFANWSFDSRSSAAPGGDYEAGSVFIGIDARLDRALR